MSSVEKLYKEICEDEVKPKNSNRSIGSKRINEVAKEEEKTCNRIYSEKQKKRDIKFNEKITGSQDISRNELDSIVKRSVKKSGKDSNISVVKKIIG